MTIEVLKPSEGRVYLDHNATTPPLADISRSLLEWLDVWGNPSSIHWAGRGPKTILRETREKLAGVLGCHPLELIFTSGGSEANNLVLRGTVEYWLRQGRRPEQIHFITSTIEHPSVKKTIDELEKLQVRVTRINVDRQGHFDWSAFEASFHSDTVLVSIMAANNETGTLLPIAKIAKFAHERGVKVHSDAVQALGKITVNLVKWDVDYASFSAHKFHALKGAGWLFAKKNSPLCSQITGGGQERQRRGGTENILAIRSIKEIVPYLWKVGDIFPQVTELRNYFEIRIRQELDGITITAESSPRLPNTSSLVISGVDGETLLMRLDLAGYAVSTGAACSSGSPEPSPVLLAMGLSREEAQSSLRVSYGWENTRAEVDDFVGVLKEVVTHLRSLNRTV
jgi:cysteine desulfurase